MSHPNRSETIGKLAEALSKAQGTMRAAEKDKDNPFFKSSYADLASIWDACRKPLSDNGLAVIQTLGKIDNITYLTSVLMHSSGEWMESTIPVLPVKQDPQSLGAAITYMRRFALSALVGIAPREKGDEEAGDDSDDDGESAMGRNRNFQSDPSDYANSSSSVPIRPTIPPVGKVVIAPAPPKLTPPTVISPAKKNEEILSAATFVISDQQIKGIQTQCSIIGMDGEGLIALVKDRYRVNSLKLLSLENFMDLHSHLESRVMNSTDNQPSWSESGGTLF